MLFKLPTFALILALLSAKIQAGGPPDLANVGNVISPGNGQTFKVGEVLLFKYQLDFKGVIGPAYQIQLQRADGSNILTFATDITADIETGTLAARFLVPNPQDKSHMSGPFQAELVILESVPMESTTAIISYNVVQKVSLTITT